MIAEILLANKKYSINLSQGISLAIPLEEGSGVNCFYAPLYETFPVIAGNFVGSTEKGGLLNFFNLRLNPHGNGTHTECVGHISKEKYTINNCLKEAHFFAKLVSIFPKKINNGDRVIDLELIQAELSPNSDIQALIIRSLPNHELKKKTNYSGSNPPYITKEAMDYIVSCNIKHLLIDLPSVDREEDGGLLLAHKSFWQYPDNIRTNCTISELIFVPDAVKDDIYLLNIQIAALELDVSPSKPIIYSLNPC